MDINWKFIARLEGGQQLNGYVPNPETSKSGVTIATGVDLGQMTPAQIQNLDIPEALSAKLSPYAQKIRQEAVDYLKDHPLTVSQEEASAIDKAISEHAVETLEKTYDGAIAGNSHSIQFHTLPSEAQTVIASVAFQYGTNLKKRAPKFWHAVTLQNWKETVSILRNFGDHYSKRRHQEADLLEKMVD